MERLTTKDYKNWIYGVGYQNKEDSKYRTKIEHKLGEFEDLCEKYNVENLGHLDIMLFVLSGETKHRLKEIQQENQALKQQLAEKDDEIEEYKIMHWNMQKQHLDFIEELDQDKIKFAIEQLEKVKEKLKTFEFNYNGSIDCCEDYVFDIFDNQIKELKKE